MSKRSLGRPKTRWVDDVRKDIEKLKVPNWETLAQDRRRCKEMVEKAKTLQKSCREEVEIVHLVGFIIRNLSRCTVT
jgi:hypothetical protein